MLKVTMPEEAATLVYHVQHIPSSLEKKLTLDLRQGVTCPFHNGKVTTIHRHKS